MKISQLATITLVFCSLLTNQAVAEQHVFDQVISSSVWIYNHTEGSSGSGVLIDEANGIVLTNQHVVGKADRVTVFFANFNGSEVIGKKDYYLKNKSSLGIVGHVAAYKYSSDLALIQVERVPSNVYAVSLANTSARPGESIHSIGNPSPSDALFGYVSGSVRSVYRRQFTLSSGKKFDFKVVETTATLFHGNSGGPIVNNQGQLVALVQSGRPGSGFSTCIDISEIYQFLREVQSINRESR